MRGKGGEEGEGDNIVRSGERRKERRKCVGEEGRVYECRSMEGDSSSCKAHIRSHA